MKTTLILCALALVAPIAAAPKHSYGGGGSSGESSANSYVEGLGSATGAADAERTGSHHSNTKYPWAEKSGKKKHHKSGKAPYPTIQPTGGFTGPLTGTGGGTGALSQPTYMASLSQPEPSGFNSGSPQPVGGSPQSEGGGSPTGKPKGGSPQSVGGSPQSVGGGSPTGKPTGGSGTGTGTGSTSVPSTPASSDNGTVSSSGGISPPAGCQVKNGVGIGWLPGTSEKIGDIESALGVTACFDGQYAQITGTGPYTDSSDQLLPSLTQIIGGKTVFVASLMPSIPFSSVDSTVAGGIANVMKQFTDKGIEVWLRFAHEMNYYVTDGTYHGTAPEFQTAWATVSSAVASNDKVKMFWSPNQASAASIESGGWFPTSGKVDIVGIDIYPKSQQTFGATYGDFCKTFSTGKNLPFVIGETGAGPDIKQYWLGQLAQGDKSACPNYVGFSWFDYNKEEDFQVVEGGSTIAKQVLG